MRLTALAVLPFTLLACSDGTTGGGGPRVGDDDMRRRTTLPIPEAGAGDVAADATVADAADDACLRANGITSGRAATTDDGGAAALFDPASGTYVTVSARGADDQPLAGAAVRLAVGAEAFAVLVRAPGQLPTYVQARREAGAVAFGVDAQTQLHDGVEAAQGRAPAAEVPGCLSADLVVEVHSRHLPVTAGVARLVAAPWQDDRCQSDEWAPTCAALEGLEARINPGAPAGLVLRGDDGATFGALAGLGALEADWPRLRSDTCGDALDTALVGWVVPDEAEALLSRFRLVGQRLQLLLIRLSREPPPEAQAAGAAVADLLAPFAQVAWLVRLGGVDLHPTDDGWRFVERNALLGAAAAVKQYAQGRGLGLDFDAPYDGLLLRGDAPELDGLGYRVTEPDAVGCARAAVTDLTTRSGASVAVSVAIRRMLDVLDAGLREIEVGHWPPQPDVGPAPDAGIPDAAAVPDAGPPPDGAVPDAAVVEPDAFVPMGGPCEDDALEPNPDWRPLVAGRNPPGGANLVDLTLPPGDADWHVFDIGNFSLNVQARLEASDHCAADPGIRVCMDLWQWGWTNEEGLLDDEPFHQRGPFCGPVRAALDSGRFGMAGLAGEPWISVLVHIYREDDSPNAAAYRLSFTH